MSKCSPISNLTPKNENPRSHNNHKTFSFCELISGVKLSTPIIIQNKTEISDIHDNDGDINGTYRTCGEQDGRNSATATVSSLSGIRIPAFEFSIS